MQKDKPFLLITGMHRSGTSFLARALNFSGVYLGSLDLLDSHELAPKPDNLYGNWEHKELQHLGNEWLTMNGGSWHEPPSTTNITNEMADNITRNVNDLHKHASLASGYKDPRICLYYDSWKQYFPSNTIVIGIFRHPTEVASSLKKRDRFDNEKSLQLWKAYNDRLLEILGKGKGFLIDFDWSVERIIDELKEICAALGLLDASERMRLWFNSEQLHSSKNDLQDGPVAETLSVLQARANVNKRHLSRFNIPNWKNREIKDILKQNIWDSSEDMLTIRKIQSGRIIERNEQKTHPLGALLLVYGDRRDLQKSFPEVKKGQYYRLIRWAKNNHEKNPIITPFKAHYESLVNILTPPKTE